MSTSPWGNPGSRRVRGSEAELLQGGQNAIDGSREDEGWLLR